MRAKKGGEIGANGEFYEGGKFIATTERPKGKQKAKKATGRQEIAAYKWEIPPVEWMKAIFSIVGCMAKYVDRYKIETGITPVTDEKVVAYYGSSCWGWSIQELCERYNRGEMWIAPKEII